MLALLLAVGLAAAIVLSGGSSYRVRLVFANASGLVSGDEVMIGPVNVGTVQSIGLTPQGQAAITVGVESEAAPLHRGTTAQIGENGLASVAGHYVILRPGSSSRPAIPSGGTIGATNTTSEVSLDEVFDTLDPLTRAGIRNLIRGESAAIAGRAPQANRALHYLAPALYSTSQVTAELDRSEPAFDALLVQGADTMQALAARSNQLTQLISSGDTATGAIASQSTALRRALALLPGALSRSTATFTGLRTTLDALSPLVAESKPAVRRLAPFSAALRRLAVASIPTLTELADLIHNPAGTGDLTSLLREAPQLARVASRQVPAIIAELNASQSQLDYLREYTPDVISALSNIGQASGYYDANGHYTRTQPVFNAFGLSSNNQLTEQPPSDRLNGLSVVHGRCPGGAMQPSPDGTAPEQVPGCRPSSSPSGS